MFELVIQNGKLEGNRLMLPLDKPIVAGRDEGCQLALQSTLVSRRHSELKHVAGGIWVQDLGSQNGTYVNEVAITEPTLMKSGDLLRIGAIVFEVQQPQPGGKGATAQAVSAAAKARQSAKVSDDDIADWLSTEDTVIDHRPAGEDTTVIRGRSTSAGAEATSAPPAAPPPAVPRPPTTIPQPKAKQFRSVKDEAADIIRRHWAKVRGEAAPS